MVLRMKIGGGGGGVTYTEIRINEQLRSIWTNSETIQRDVTQLVIYYT